MEALERGRLRPPRQGERNRRERRDGEGASRSPRPPLGPPPSARAGALPLPLRFPASTSVPLCGLALH